MIHVIRCRAAAFIILLLWALASRAEVVSDLYLGQVPVGDRGQTQLAEAANKALAQVYVKVSGSAEVLALPAVAATLDDAIAHAQQFSYARHNDPDFPLLARFEFNANWVTGVLKQAGAPLWTANRPAVLVWLVQQGSDGPQFVSRDSNPELVDLLTERFGRRGVPIRFPLLDLSDAAALSPRQVWQASEAPLALASRRYQAREVLSGRLQESGEGVWAFAWTYYSPSGRLDREPGPASLAVAAQTAADLVAEDMAARYAISAGSASEQGLAMIVSNVRNYADYAAVLTWLERLELVDQVQVERVAGEHLHLRLQTRVNPEQLATIFELNRSLIPDNYGPRDGKLRYQWQN